MAAGIVVPHTSEMPGEYCKIPLRTYKDTNSSLSLLLFYQIQSCETH